MSTNKMGSNDKEDKKSANNGSTDKEKFKKSEYLAPLPKLEIWLYFILVIGHIAYLWYLVWAASTSLEKRLYSGFFEQGAGILKRRRRDKSNYEWNIYFDHLKFDIPAFCIHVISMRVLDRCFADKRKFEMAMLLIWTGILYAKIGWQFIVTFLFGAVMLTVSRLFSWKPIVWLCGCLLLTTVSTEIYLIDDLVKRYRFAVANAYKMLLFFSFCLTDIDSKRAMRSKAIDDEKKPESPGLPYITSPVQAYIKMMQYSLYPPYASTLIVVYSDFTKQWNQRRNTKVFTRRFFFMIVRVAFWTLFNEGLLHFIYTNAMMYDPHLLEELDLFTLVAVWYTCGQFFHMKYVTIFGVNSVFAIFDGMTPQKWPPVCISRVALYADLWRNFDRGLYVFLRDHVFIPISRPSFSFLRRTFASVLAFFFIWLWHGTAQPITYWVIINFTEATLESLGKEFYRLPAVYNFLHNRFSPAMIRRIRALSHVVCMTLGMFAIVYFLGGIQSGDVFVKRLFFDKRYHLKLPYLYIFSMWYCFAHLCMEVDAWMKR